MKSNRRNAPKTDLFPTTSIWCGSRGIKYSEDFREVVYKINPVYLSCMYKRMFESNATKTLRNIDNTIDMERIKDGNNNPKEKQVSKDDNDNSINGRDLETLKRISRNISKSDGVLAQKNYNCGTNNVVQVQYPVQRRIKKSASGLQGWGICKRPHSLSTTSIKISEDDDIPDCNRHRSHSANSSPIPIRRDKVFTPKLYSSGSRLINNASSYKCQDSSDYHKEDLHSSSSTMSGSSCSYSTPGYITTQKPIKYKFKHYDHSMSYIDDYREEYTYKMLAKSEPQPPSACHCEERTPNICIPVIPMMPLFRWIEPPESRLRLNDAAKTRDIKKTQQTNPQVSPITSAAKLNKPQVKSPLNLSSRQTPHYLLSQTGVLRTEYYNNPLCIDNTFKNDKSRPKAMVCRSRPSIPSNAHGRIHPSSTESGIARGSHVMSTRKSAQ